MKNKNLRNQESVFVKLGELKLYRDRKWDYSFLGVIFFLNNRVQELADVIAQSRALCPPQRRFKQRSLVRTCVFNFSDSDLVRALLDYLMQFSKVKPSKWRHWRITLHGRRVKNEYLWNITFRREFVAMMEKWNAQTTSLCVSLHPSPSPDLPTYKNQTGS